MPSWKTACILACAGLLVSGCSVLRVTCIEGNYDPLLSGVDGRISTCQVTQSGTPPEGAFEKLANKVTR